MSDNTNLNLNPARKDKFFFALGDIPSSVLLTPKETTEIQKRVAQIEDKHFYNLALKSLVMPGISLGEVKINTMFSPIAETDMKYTFEPLTTEIKMDKDYLIYKLLILWMILIKQPDTFNQFGMKKTFDKTATTGILTILNNFSEPVISLEFYDLRPLSIPSIDLSYESEGEEITVNITWSYSYYMPRKATGLPYDTAL